MRSDELIPIVYMKIDIYITPRIAYKINFPRDNTLGIESNRTGNIQKGNIIIMGSITL